MERIERTIYMPLVGERADCWRPVRATQIGDDIFEVVDRIPENETWAFAPCSRVLCRNKVFTDGRVDLVIFAYAIEGHPYYRLLKDHTRQVFRIILADGEEAVVRVMYVDEEHDDFVCDLLSTNREQKYRGTPNTEAYAIKFADLVSARLQE